MRKQAIMGAGLAFAALAFSAGVAQADPDPNDPGNVANWPCGVTVGPVTTTTGTVIGIRGGKPCPPPAPAPPQQP
ncbi:hypothetical protein [Mycobacterium sp. Marseille-P9652]|uniref:hypothetical protein n=1 Tax=Mycobacterium sp. Marseille-P9652 TaxID=2654950 RepID=UPI0012E846C5|nr:hypothetical protein [Mycobacterium sp. Marseille-P9652]